MLNYAAVIPTRASGATVGLRSPKASDRVVLWFAVADMSF